MREADDHPLPPEIMEENSVLPTRKSMREAYDNPLPAEIIEEILSYLPVKSLSRFRYVSTTWRSLISKHRFVRKHLSRAAQDLSQKTLILSNPVGSGIEKLLSFPLSSLQIKPGPLIIDGGDCWHLEASCDGLLCLRVDRSVYIWNPCTKIYRKVLSPTGTETFDNLNISLFGLGYDSTRDDYKLFKHTRHRVTTETQVYSLRGASWRKVNNLPKDYGPFTNAAFVSGSIHWLAFRDLVRPNPPFALISFDVSEVEYREMHLPDECWPMPPNYLVFANVCVLNGLLCVVIVSDSRLFLWALKGYYCYSSWTKILDIEFGHEIFDSLGNAMEFKPLYQYENGEVLMVVASQILRTELMICKDNSVLFREIIIDQEPCWIRYGVLHVESLISPLPAINLSN